MRVIQTEGTATTAAAPASSPSTRRRVIFMVRLTPKRRASARGWATGRVHENAILPRLFLTFMVCGGLTAPILEKTFFSTHRPAPETGGQRPTARCALGRKGVWNIILSSLRRERDKTWCHHPRKRVIQYPKGVRFKAKPPNTGYPDGACHRAALSADPGAGYDGGEIGDAVPVGGMAVSSPSPRSCGERVGVRGSYLLESGTPSPGLHRTMLRIAEGDRTSPRRRGEVKKEKQQCSTICRKSLVAFSIG